jgi:hypothetical protein
VLTAEDLGMNVLDFRRRSFQFDRLVELAGGPHAVFTRTETESERQLRPKLVRLTVVVPLAWVLYDEAADVLRLGRKGAGRPATEDPAIEVAAEPPEFEEDGVRWKRAPTGPAGYVYAPAELAGQILSREGLAELGLA